MYRHRPSRQRLVSSTWCFRHHAGEGDTIRAGRRRDGELIVGRRHWIWIVVSARAENSTCGFSFVYPPLLASMRRNNRPLQQQHCYQRHQRRGGVTDGMVATTCQCQRQKTDWNFRYTSICGVRLAKGAATAISNAVD